MDTEGKLGRCPERARLGAFGGRLAISSPLTDIETQAENTFQLTEVEIQVA